MAIFGKSRNVSKSNKAFKSLNEFFFLVGDIGRFAARFFKEGFKAPFEWREIMRQSVEIGYHSLSLVGITAFIMGLVLTIQSRPTLVEFGAESWLPAMVSVSIVREIGPVITALIFAGKIGSRIGAELGSMKATEQIDAMEVSGTNPFKYLVTTRILSTTLMLPLLVIFADVIALYGAYLGVNIKGIVSPHLFFSQVIDALEYSDLIPYIIKTFFFGFTIGLIGCYMGYHSKKGTEGVGKSANSSVVIASLMVFILDLLAVQITDLFYEI
ncbi:MAG: ABC transporter permease [Bacteroidetes bacterium]|nr:MAG: ABC transporter permease [Bacteroidota bacterium]MBL1144955.1 ABC transporter permease [Bacteroidota bacterium]NOG57749.1 ABC transporter permease [Bacteroidota bacterium]